MDKRFFVVALVGACSLVMVACGGKKAKAKPETVREAAFPYPAVPQLLTDEKEKHIYFLEHYWDNVNFSDTTLLPASNVLHEAFYKYAEVVSDARNIPYGQACGLLGDMLDKASADTAVYLKMIQLFKLAYYDANSPLENDEYYLPVLRHEIKCPVLSIGQRDKAIYELNLVSRNQSGMAAADFAFTLADGSSSNLHRIESDFTLLLFHNPGCHACEELHVQLEASVLLREMMKNGTLKVLAVYPDADLKEWYDYQPMVPKTWINAYDKGAVIRQQELYDLKAIPMMYLLDAKKNVLLKDCRFRQLEDYLLAKLNGSECKNGDGPAFPSF